jgi:hypothetical protein
MRKKQIRVMDLEQSYKIITENKGPFPAVVMEIPAYTQNLNQEFICRKVP